MVLDAFGTLSRIDTNGFKFIETEFSPNYEEEIPMGGLGR